MNGGLSIAFAVGAGHTQLSAGWAEGTLGLVHQGSTFGLSTSWRSAGTPSTFGVTGTNVAHTRLSIKRVPAIQCMIFTRSHLLATSGGCWAQGAAASSPDSSPDSSPESSSDSSSVLALSSSSHAMLSSGDAAADQDAAEKANGLASAGTFEAATLAPSSAPTFEACEEAPLLPSSTGVRSRERRAQWSPSGSSSTGLSGGPADVCMAGGAPAIPLPGAVAPLQADHAMVDSCPATLIIHGWQKQFSRRRRLQGSTCNNPRTRSFASSEMPRHLDVLMLKAALRICSSSGRFLPSKGYRPLNITNNTTPSPQRSAA
mmetsp:Transcript_120151/g.340059  ORF Transcript_120151/g.340059 Transcript_120151/m.340059 type:complete len:316 (+) Transcript_120151:1495-2442(+)